MKPEDLRPIDSREEELQIQLPPRPALVRPPTAKLDDKTRYPLRGMPGEYKEPTEPVAESDWEALK